MPRVSKLKLNSEKLIEISQHFSFLVSSLTGGTEIENFLDQFLTKEEKVMLAKRLVLFTMLRRNYPPPVIQTALHVSYETVRSYQNSLDSKSSSFLKSIDKVINMQKSKDFFVKIEKLLKPLDLALRAKTNMKARAKLVSRDW
ncbi:MAG: Trp family transcriptional regulator [Patescibacteria group bacterium]